MDKWAAGESAIRGFGAKCPCSPVHRCQFLQQDVPYQHLPEVYLSGVPLSVGNLTPCQQEKPGNGLGRRKKEALRGEICRTFSQVVHEASIVTQPTDGNCLFHALSYGLKALAASPETKLMSSRAAEIWHEGIYSVVHKSHALAFERTA